MNTMTSVFAASFFLSFFIGFGFFRLKDRFVFSELLPLFLIPLVGFITLFYWLPDKSDFVSGLKIYEPLAAFALSVVVFFAAGAKNRKTEILALAAASVILAALPSKTFLLFEGYLPFWLDRIIAAAIIFAFAFYYGFLNTVRGILPTQTISICAGLFVISVIGAIPILLGTYALVIAGIFAAFMAFNLVKINLSDRTSSAIGLIIAWLLLKSSEEFSASCCLILLLPFAINFLWAICQKVNHLINGDSKHLYEYSAIYRLHMLNVSEITICKSYAPINFLMIIFAAMQTYAQNNFSFPIVGALFVVWYISKIQTVETPEELDKEAHEPMIEMPETPEQPKEEPSKVVKSSSVKVPLKTIKKKPAAQKKKTAPVKKKSPAKPIRKTAKRK